MSASVAASAPASTNLIPDAGSSMGNLPQEALGEKLPLAWDLPAGWEDLGPSGIRIATLRAQGQECTILSFPGDVGGDEANIRRWLGQIGQQPADDAIKQLIETPVTVTTMGGFAARLYDFASILPADAAISTRAAIIPVNEQTVFIKMTGDKATLAALGDAFDALCRSIRLKSEGAPE